MSYPVPPKGRDVSCRYRHTGGCPYLQPGVFSNSDVVGDAYTRIYPTMKDFYLKLLSLGVRALVYNGDTDMACNFLGDQWFVEDLGIQVKVCSSRGERMIPECWSLNTNLYVLRLGNLKVPKLEIR